MLIGQGITVNRLMKKTRSGFRFLWVVTACALLVSPAGAALQVTDGTPVQGAVMGGVDGAVEVTVTDSRAIIDWATLDTEVGELLKFMGEGAYAVLNRVQQAKRTEFMGNLEASGGHVIIVNPYGIVFGPQSLIEADQFTASSLMIDEQDFLDGNYAFTGSGEMWGEIVNNGTIVTTGQAALIGARVINKGSIMSYEGGILMATGDRVVLGSEGSSVVVEVEGVLPAAGSDMGHIINEGLLATAIEGDIVLAAGDTFAQSLSVGNVGRIRHSGTIIAAGDLEAAALGEVWFAEAAIPGNPTTTVSGDINIKGGAVTLEEDLVAGNDMTIVSHITQSRGSLSAEGNITLETNLELNGGQWTPDAEGTMIYEGQKVDARTGTLTAEGWIRKTTPGELHLHGGDPDLAIDLKDYVASRGNMYICGKGDIQVARALIAAYPGASTPKLPPQAEYTEYVMPHDVGGVSVISSHGRIYTEGTIGLNALILGYSNDVADYWDAYDYLPAGAGVDLPCRDAQGNALGNAAIVLQSKDALILGTDAMLIATGYYLPAGSQREGPAGVDDRSAVGFLTRQAVLGDHSRHPGVPMDVAIYACSTRSDVVVNTCGFAVIEGTPEWIFTTEVDHTCPILGPATVVFDAWDKVAFGLFQNENLTFENDIFENDIFKAYNYTGCLDGCLGKYLGNFRLEACSRRTEWLDQAISWGTLPFADKPELVEQVLHGYDYVLRGARVGNLPPGRNAWVLACKPLPPLPPHPRLAVAPLPLFERPEPEGCPAALAAAAAELDISADGLQLLIGSSLAAHPNIQPCAAASRLVRAAAVLKDPHGEYMAAVASVFEQLAPPDAPLTPERIASITAVLSDLTGEDTDRILAAAYVDAFVQYAAAIGDLGSLVENPHACVVDKYGQALIESPNSNILAFVLSLLEQHGS